MYQIEEPTYFIYLIAIPILFAVFLLVSFWKKRTQKKFTDELLLKRLTPEKSLFKSYLKMILFLVGFTFLIVSLTNPKMGTKLETVKRQGVDIVFALDVSKSMLAEDIAPNRLEKAKQIISKIIDKLGSDRIGIIIYAGNSYPLLPITTDHGAAKMFLQSANPDMVSSQGTAINEAIVLANTYYDNDEQTNRFLFIISDGEDHQEDASSAIELTSKNGIKTYTIGVGNPQKGAPIPLKSNGVIEGYKKDSKGEVVLTKMSEETLNEIADKGNGKYVLGNRTQKTVDYVEEILTKAEKTEFETKQFSDYKDQFQWFVGFALLFIVLDAFMLEKKTKWIQKLNLFNKE
ncbi:MAG: VWA domain-containing protein [Urechidicola sp.]|nr:VWA domain-containing protein [Urechidicola sp.]